MSKKLENAHIVEKFVNVHKSPKLTQKENRKSKYIGNKKRNWIGNKGKSWVSTKMTSMVHSTKHLNEK